MPTVHHCGVTVSDLDRSLEFYTEALGLDIADSASFDSEAFNRLVGTEDRTAEVAFLDGGGCQVELLEYDEAANDRNEAEASNTVGATHLSLAVDDIQARYEALSDDVEFISEPQTLDNKVNVVMLFDPDGNVVELLEE